MRHLLAVVVLLATVAACDSSAEFEIGGTYSGVTEDFGGGDQTTASFDLPTTENGGTFSFTAVVREVSGGQETINTASGTGTYDHPAITLTVEGDTSEGTVQADGSAFTLEIEPGDFVTFRRN